jgi:hypothetical protein
MQVFKVPKDADGAGLFVGGAFYSFTDTPDGRALVLPDAGDYGQLLGHLGYVQVTPPTPTPTPKGKSAAAA